MILTEKEAHSVLCMNVHTEEEVYCVGRACMGWDWTEEAKPGVDPKNRLGGCAPSVKVHLLRKSVELQKQASKRHAEQVAEAVKGIDGWAARMEEDYAEAIPVATTSEVKSGSDVESEEI